MRRKERGAGDGRSPVDGFRGCAVECVEPDDVNPRRTEDRRDRANLVGGGGGEEELHGWMISPINRIGATGNLTRTTRTTSPVTPASLDALIPLSAPVS